MNDLARIYEYIYRKEIRLENEETQMYNNMVYRRADTLDLLELITMKVRQATAAEIFGELHRILAQIRREQDKTDATILNEYLV